MPINTDNVDLSQPLAGQVIESEPIANPVIPKERIKAIGDIFRKAGGETPKPQTEAPPAPPADVPPKSDAKAPAEAPNKKAPETPEPEKHDPTELDPATLMSPRSRDRFRKLEESRDSYKVRAEKAEKAEAERVARLAALEQELTALKTNATPELAEIRQKAEIAAKLEEENKKLLAKVESIDFERSDRFQNWWREETSKNIKLAQSVVPAEKREELGKLLMDEPSADRTAKLGEIVGSLDEVSKSVVGGALKDLLVAKQKRAEALAENSQSLQKLRAQEQLERQQAAKAEAARREQITQAALARAKNLEAFKPIEGDAEHNSAIPFREDFIKAAIAGQLEEDLAVAIPGLAFEAIHLRDKVVPTLRAELEKRDLLIKQLQAASPAPGTGSASSEAPKVKPGASGGFLAAVKKAMAGER